MIRVTHVIDGLSVGGAEVMLADLVRASSPDRFRHVVISLTDVGPIGADLRRDGYCVEAVGLEAGWSSKAARVVRLPFMIRRTRPDVVHTWLYHADLLGGLAARLSVPRARVLWGLHRADIDRRWTKPRLDLVARACARLSRLVPHRILACSEEVARVHAAMGYDAARMVVVANGVDTDLYRPDPQAREAVRAGLGIGADTPVVGMVARFDPVKDHANLLDAVALVLRSRPELQVVLCGDGVGPDDAGLRSLLASRPEVVPNVHLLGLRRDVDRVDAALDVAVLSSVGDALPLAIAEAMACAVPCVVTDVGDLRALVGDTGRVVPPRDPRALAAAIVELLDMSGPERRQLGDSARCRVVEHYGVDGAVRDHEALYLELSAR